MEMQVNTLEENIPVKGMNFLQRIIAVIVSPGKLMEELERKPRVLFGLILALFSHALVYLIKLPLYQNIMRKSLELSAQMMKKRFNYEMTPEMIEKSVNGWIQNLATIAVFYLIVLIVGAFIFFVLFKIFGGKGKFKHYLSVMSYSYVISSLYLLIVLIVSNFTGNLYIDIPLTSVANLLPSDMRGTFFFGIMRGIDLFSIWCFSVIAIGMAQISKAKKPIVYGIVGVVFIAVLIYFGVTELNYGQMLQ